MIIQTVITLVLVAMAFVIVARRLWSLASAQSASSCSGCSGKQAAPTMQVTPLVQLGISPANDQRP